MNTSYDQRPKEQADVTTNKILFGSKEGQSRFSDENLSASGSEIHSIEDYTFMLPDGLNIIANYDEIEKITSANIKKQAIQFLDEFLTILYRIKKETNFSGSLPKLWIKSSDDGSILIEWILKDFRIGFTFEEDEKESSWYIVSNEKFGNINISGTFINANLYNLLEQIVSTVMVNI